MALIPGSYARAAGLQSEINKVTITRVAGSEVQFRRTIDTYQRDLRYNVNQIGREQRQLKKSMRKYSRKLRDSRKEQKERKDKVKEDTERLKQQSESFKQAEKAVRKSTYANPKPQAEASVVENEQSAADDSANQKDKFSAQFENGDPEISEAADGHSTEAGLEDKSDALVHTGPGQASKDGEKPQPHKVFLTKNSLPYLRAKRNHTEKSERSDKSHQHDEMSDDETPSAELSLPIINEEADCSSDPKGNKTRRADIVKLSDSNSQTEENSPSSDSATLDKTPKAISNGVPTVTITSINTKAISKNEKTLGSLSGRGGDSELSDAAMTLPALVGRGRRGAGKTGGVSFGDLIKLQHMPSSSSKKLFKLVDRLAAKHGIKDIPEAAAMSTSSSLDPRSNEKIKQKRHNEDTQMSDGMVRQAAVLYSMKYGYHEDDDQFFGDTLPPIILSQDTPDGFSSHHDTTRADSTVAKLHVTSRRSSNANEIHRNLDIDVSDMASRRLSLLSIRRGSVEVTSPRSALGETRWSASAKDDKSAELTSLDSQKNRPGQRRYSQVPIMSELSRQTTRIRERTILETDFKPSPNSLDPNEKTQDPERTTRRSRSARMLSVLSHHSRPRSRSRRETVNSQLQKRLKSNHVGDGDQTNNAWQSAFGRLKLVHTLKDLSQHFQRDGK
ncbi:hypothetical protein ACOMHN_015530 [Nucella lapillus]